MEPWTGVFDETLVRLDGEKDLAPRVLAMAGRRRCARPRFRREGEDGRLLCFWVFSGTI